MSPPSTAAVMPSGAHVAPRRLGENLALHFQELFTVAVRLRANRHHVADVASFRAQIHQAVRISEEKCRKSGYSREDTRLAIFAVVAFLDEQILNSENPVFGDWVRRPLQEELFGVHVAGEVFFNGLNRLLERDDSAALADLLEVYYLCLLLGYGGRYSLGAKGHLQSITDKVGRRIFHIRSNLGRPAAPEPQPQTLPALRSDPWVRRLSLVALSCLAIALACFLFYWLSLDSGASALQAIAERGA